MKTRPIFVSALLLMLAFLVVAAFRKISDYTTAPTLTDTYSFEVVNPGASNYSVTFGALATNLANRLGIPPAPTAAAGGDWIVNEQFFGDVSTFTLGAVGSSPWRYSNVGTVPVPPGPVLGEGAMTGILSLVTTQSLSGHTLYIGPNGGQFLNMTNGELFVIARIRMGQTNVTGDVSTLRVGIGRIDGATEVLTGAFFQANTNVGTNTLVCITSRANTRTITYTPYVWTPRKWFNAAIYFDATGTNAIFYAGTTMTNMTPIATNTVNLPGGGTSNLNPYISNWRICSSGGLAAQTNFVDWYKLWARSDQE